ncbi:MAG: hypothetical protein OJF52_000027 [Nitrospira sp.]|nr:MAG: hypothetical protein OJF52_000027 [Nitrospira sp.]
MLELLSELQGSVLFFPSRAMVATFEQASAFRKEREFFYETGRHE